MRGALTRFNRQRPQRENHGHRKSGTRLSLALRAVAGITGNRISRYFVLDPTTMTTSGHAAGTEAVWPSGGWTMSEDGTSISRSDGVEMSIVTLNQTNFKVTFIVSEETNISGRIAALDGDYMFDLE